MNITQLEAKGIELEKRLVNFETDVENNPRLTEHQKQQTFEALTAEFKALKAEKRKHEIGEAFITRMGTNPTGVGSAPDTNGRKALSNIRPNGQTITTTGADLQPLSFDGHAIEALRKGFEAKSPTATLITKDFNTVETGYSTTTSSLLPAELNPSVVARVHEDRVYDHLPCVTATSLNYEFICDETTSNGITGPTAEGVAAPDVTLTFGAKIVEMVPLKATFGLSYESLQDWPTLLGYVQAEISRQITDLENSQVLTATGTTGNMNGLINQAANTIAVPATLPTGATALDYVLQGINTLRTVPNVLGVADQIWLHPNDWFSLVGIKDAYGRYMITPDPTEDAPKKLWNIPVYTTTAMTAGTAVIMDSTKMGFGIIRQGIQLHQGYNAADFSEFIQRYALIWRGQLAVVRPGAILTITGLPATAYTP
ncbi:phage major capsid protein [Mycobacterium sp. HUMS_1102779]